MNEKGILFDVMKAVEARNFVPEKLTENVPEYDRFIEILCAVSPAPVLFSDLPKERSKDTYGAYDHINNRILICQCLPELQTVRAVLHEMAHAVLHPWPDGQKPDTWDETKRPREIQAEAMAYTVCRHYGLDTTAYSIPYIASWARKLSVPEIEANLDAVRQTAQDLIAEIDTELHGAKKEVTS